MQHDGFICGNAGVSSQGSHWVKYQREHILTFDYQKTLNAYF